MYFTNCNLWLVTLHHCLLIGVCIKRCVCIIINFACLLFDNSHYSCMYFLPARRSAIQMLTSGKHAKSNTLFTSLQTKGYSDSPSSIVSVQLFSLSLHPLPSFSLSLSLPLSRFLCLSFLFLRRAHSFKLISHEPPLIVWLQSPHAAAMVTGRVYSSSEHEFNTTFDDIGRMRCTRMCLCVCMCQRA